MNKDEQKKGPAPAQGPKKVFDVTRPGRVLASPTSRPVIASHMPPTADDQFVKQRATETNDEAFKLGKHKQQLGLKQPEPVSTEEASQTTTTDIEAELAALATAPLLDETSKPNTAETQEEAQATAAPETEMTANTPAAPPAPETEMPVVTPASSVPPEQPNSVQKSSDEAEFSKPMSQDDVLAETGAPTLEQAIVSHHQRHRTKIWEWFLILLLMVVVAAAALNFLLDAEVLTTGLDLPHTDLFK